MLCIVQAQSPWPAVFSGMESITIPAGATMISDSVDLDVPPLGSVAVSLYFPDVTPTSTVHGGGRQMAYIVPGNKTADVEIVSDNTTLGRLFLSAITVDAPEDARAIVTFGDSITDGDGSTSDPNTRWPDVLAKRLQDKGDVRRPFSTKESPGNVSSSTAWVPTPWFALKKQSSVCCGVCEAPISTCPPRPTSRAPLPSKGFLCLVFRTLDRLRHCQAARTLWRSGRAPELRGQGGGLGRQASCRGMAARRRCAACLDRGRSAAGALTGGLWRYSRHGRTVRQRREQV